MTQEIIELAQVRLAAGKTEEDLLQASEAFQSGFLSWQDGFVRRDMVRRKDGPYVDIIKWTSQAQADAVFQKAQASELAGNYFSMMASDPENMDEGVEHCPLISSFSAA